MRAAVLIALAVSALLGTVIATASTDSPIERAKIVALTVGTALPLTIASELLTS